ncbi:probable 3-hydroxyisobutyrate dehydrogenase-like 3, mitochondrial [Aristolochia californica]|uniref:probable 3-hydroxyisobutyrate dehydrogenase-like 3, mitochondrial n=1 Tax=Aristolochia californica TaxID=171875 RepID=UPI0035D8FFA2
MEIPYPGPIKPSQTRVGWIAVCVMGMARATVYASSPDKAVPLQQRGTSLAYSPADVARTSDVVFTTRPMSDPSSAGSKVMELFGKRMAERDFRMGDFAEYMVKDLGMGFQDEVV